MKNITKGEIIIIITLLITILLWIFSKSDISVLIKYPFISLNQISALLGTLLLSWSLVLITRLDFLDEMFDGLTNVYAVHKKSAL